MKNKIVLFSVLTVFALFAVIAVPSVSATYPANAIYLNPEDSSGLYCENNTLVEVRVNASVVTTGVQTSICFDPTCVNITDVDYTGSAWPPLAPPGWTHFGDHVTLIGIDMAGEPAGDNLFATIRLHCVKEEYCLSDLEFRNVIVLDNDVIPAPIDITLHNGTFTCLGEPDLTVTEVTVNYDASSLGGLAIGPEPGLGVHTECNNLSAVIAEENEVDVGSPFDVTFKVDGDTLCTVRVPGLTGGSTETVYCNCCWSPMAGDDFAIIVTVDSNHEIPESNETNNTKWNNGTVVSNGFKGDGWQGPDKNLENVQCHKQDTINLTYSVGDSYYAGGTWGETTNYLANWTTSDLPIPEDADILKAWLYVYYCYDKNEIMPDGVSLTFNGPGVTFAKHYSDRKGFGTYDYPYGMLVYDVTDKFNLAGNRAVLTKPAPDTYIPIRGMLLMVVYNHPNERERIICIDEGYDMLYAKDSYAVTSEEATTYAPFTCCEPVPVEKIVKATLIAVAPSASDGDDKNRLSFNDGLWKGAWSGYAGATQLGIAEANVLAYLKPADNRANFQSHIPAGETKGDFMEASNVFLILEKNGEIPCPCKYAVYQAKVSDPEGILNPLRELRDGYLKEEYVDRYYDYSTELTMVMTKDPALTYEAARLLVEYLPMIQQQVTGTGKVKLITGRDVEEVVSFIDGLKRSVLKNRGEIGATRSQEIINFLDEFEEQVEASEGKTFSEALQSSIYCESESMPDLVITNIRLDGNKVKYTIKNQGEAATGGLFVNTLLVDGVPVSEDRINRLIQPGQGLEKTLILSGPLKISPNTTIVVCADFKNKVPESDEENNCLVLE